MTAKLIGEEGNLKDQEFGLTEEVQEYFIGRDPDTCQLVVEDPGVSRKHLVIRPSADGYVIENLRPTNPVEVNDAVLEEPALLRDGDAIRIGGVLLRFFSEENGEGGAQVHVEAESTDTEEDEESELEDVLTETDLETEEKELAAIDLSTLQGSRWMVKVVAGPNTGAEFPIEEGNQYLIGTDTRKCDIVFHDISVSKQHAKLISEGRGTFRLEDLDSRNGVMVDGEPIEKEIPLVHNNLVTLGTTAFLLCDREGKPITVSSPIIQPLKRQKEREAAIAKPKKGTAVSAFVLLAVMAAVLIVLGIGASGLFRQEEIKQEQIDHSLVLAETLKDWPQIQYTYTKTNGRLMLLGHVLAANDRNQILYRMTELPWVKSVDDNIIVDEYIWQENNQVLSKNPEWAGVTMIAPRPGVFVLTGFLKTRDQVDALNTYMNLNFPYPSLLEKQIVVEENIISEVTTSLLEKKLGDIAAEFVNGEISLTGTVSYDKAEDLKELISRFQRIKGVRTVRNFVIELEEEQAMINLTDQYEVTGYSERGDVSLNVVINGRIVARGDTLDGMTVTAIRPDAIFLEKDGFKYRIDYKK